MSDAAATPGTSGTPGLGLPTPLTPDAIEAILADFRAWLTDLSGGANEVDFTCSRGSPEAVDLFTLVGQFTALRHEINMQTRAARAAVEQNAEVLCQLTASANEPEAVSEVENDDESLRPVAKAIIDVVDALALSLRQMEKGRDSAEALLADLIEPMEPAKVTLPGTTRPGFLARLFGTRPVPQPSSSDPESGQQVAQVVDKLRQILAAAADGYAMSLRRVERILPTLELEPLSCTGEDFDPELMEVVEVVGDTGLPSGTVVEDVRPGYLWRGKLFRFAQVKVAR
jgi:molecular chaperone GrpE